MSLNHPVGPDADRTGIAFIAQRSFGADRGAADRYLNDALADAFEEDGLATVSETVGYLPGVQLELASQDPDMDELDAAVFAAGMMGAGPDDVLEILGADEGQEIKEWPSDLGYGD